MVSQGQKLPKVSLSRPTYCLLVASEYPNPSKTDPVSHQPLKTQPLPHDGFSRPNYILLEASLDGHSSCLLRPLQAQFGPCSPTGYIDRPTSCLTRNSVDSTPAQLLVAFVGLKGPQVKLSRPTQLMPHGGLSRLSSCPPTASPGPKLQVDFF
ncbi:hypothetical protein AAY473_027549 [Plecturocebus cupreus]